MVINVDGCKRRGRISVGSQSVFARHWFPSKQRDVRLRRLYERGRRSGVLIDSETNRWGPGRPAITRGHIYTATSRSGFSLKRLGQSVRSPNCRTPSGGRAAFWRRLPEAPAVTMGAYIATTNPISSRKFRIQCPDA
jgi:hypothetical protein